VTLTRPQHFEMARTLGALSERLRELDLKIVGDGEVAAIAHVLASPLDHPLTRDSQVAMYVLVLHGLAVGLGFPSSLALFRYYGASERDPKQPPAVPRLVVTARRAVTILAAEESAACRVVTRDLAVALMPWRTPV